GFRAAVRRDRTDHDVCTVLVLLTRGLQHCVGLPDPRRRTDEDLEPASLLAGSLGRQGSGRRAALDVHHADRPESVVIRRQTLPVAATPGRIQTTMPTPARAALVPCACRRRTGALLHQAAPTVQTEASRLAVCKGPSGQRRHTAMRRRATPPVRR